MTVALCVFGMCLEYLSMHLCACWVCMLHICCACIRATSFIKRRSRIINRNLQGQRLRQHGGCSVQYIGSSMDTAADTLVWYDERHHMHVQDLHTGRNVWVEELAWAPAHVRCWWVDVSLHRYVCVLHPSLPQLQDATPNNWIPRPPLATRPQSTHLFSPNLVLATKRYEHVLLYDTRMSPNTNPAIHYRVPDTYGPYLMGAYAVHEGTRTMQVPSIHHVQSIVLGCDNECYEQPQMRLLDLRMMTAMHTQRSTRAMTRQGTCVFSVDLPKKTMYMDASGHTVVFGSVGDPVPCSECGCVHEEGFHEYQLVVWDAHEQTLLADEEGFGGEHIFGETNGQPRLSDDGRNVLVAAGTIDMECCLVWRIPMMSDRDWYRLRTANGGGAGRPVVRPCPMLSCMYTDSPTFSADMVDTLLVTGRNGTLHFYDFGEGSKESAGVGACTGCRRTPMRI